MTARHNGHGDPRALYDAKKKGLHEAVDLIRPVDVIAAPIATGQPAAFLTALAERDDYTQPVDLQRTADRALRRAARSPACA